MTSRFDDIVYKITAESTLVDPGRLQRAFEEAAETGIPLLTLLVRGKDVQEAQIMKLIAREFNLEQVSLKGIAVDKKIAESVPYKFAAYYKFAPLSIENRILTIAVTVPLDIKIQDELRMHFGFDIRMVVAGEREIVDTLARVYGLGADTIEKINGSPHEDPALDPARADESALRDRVQDIEKLAEDASVIKLVNQILLEAYKKRATDIHIEPYRSEVKLRYRIDGVLYDANASPQIKKFIMPILSRIKIMSNLNIVERRLPQDGRAIVKTQDQMLDLRISFIPTPYGESVVIRILPASMIYDLNRIGLSAADQKVFEGLISKPHGIIFVTGPTGSGKSTTLYGALGRINKKERKIITIEDPIEYEMEGIVQIQVMPEIGLSFGRGLRAMLRHDPDIMMVGEVRDLETAEIAIRVALTGHLVFSTLHTNNAASGVTRLIDIGVEPYLVASSVEAFIAQRLVRVICPACKREDDKQAPELAAQIARELKLPGTDKVKFYRGQGCEECNFTGYHGRTGIFEILVMSEALKEMVLRKPSAEALKRLALSQGMKTLRQ
ncbi:MAG: GspE/PulE family protein, partial [Candidatus Omnitrophota bacterium]